ncbi:LPS export ABC transporter periplasmic protein LptC [Thiotrichales bacterium HSG14]|nr:LPS export ABC transporter periplasmic protein LptC [Thiotrichales bacterium HSG14]
MKRLNVQWGGWFFLISLALITTWLVRSLEEDLSKATESHRRVPDYTMKNFNSTQMDEHGQLKNQLTAKTMTHYPYANTELTTPFITFYKKKQPTWTVHAEQGEISLDGNQIWLLGKTTLQQHTQTSRIDPQKTMMKIISQDVRVQLDTEYAETIKPTTIISHVGKTDCVGMRVFIPTEQIELLSQVRGHYVLP